MSSFKPLVEAVVAAETAKETADDTLATGLTTQAELAAQAAAQDALVISQQAAADDAKTHLVAAAQSLINALVGADPTPALLPLPTTVG